MVYPLCNVQSNAKSAVFGNQKCKSIKKKNRSDLIFVTQLKVKLLKSLHGKNDFAERSKILLQI